MSLRDSAKPRWAIGVGKKNDWDGRTKGINLARGNHQREWEEELKALEDEEEKAPPLSVKFDGDPQRLGFFLVHVLIYMQKYGHEIPTEGAKLRVVTLALEGAAASWMVTLHNANAPELRNFNRFMTALRQRFEDPLADRKARDRIKNAQQGRRRVAEYTEEFRNLAYRLDWPECVLVTYFKDGLNDDLYTACVARGDPARLHDWYMLAEEVEIDQARNRYRSGTVWKRSPPERKRDTAKGQVSRRAPPPASSAAQRVTEQRSAELSTLPRTGTKRRGEKPRSSNRVRSRRP